MVRTQLQQIIDDGKTGKQGKNRKEQVIAQLDPERHTGIFNIGQAEKIAQDHHGGVQLHIGLHDPFADLIRDKDSQRDP